jgi:hypothetical protein
VPQDVRTTSNALDHSISLKNRNQAREKEWRACAQLKGVLE